MTLPRLRSLLQQWVCWLSLTIAAAQQIPLTSTPIQQQQPDLDFTSVAPHIFSSLRYLLEQWPNTYMPNGHSIVPCEIPAFTNLYHGRRDEKLPSSPEWFAFDVEMSYGIMGSDRNSHLLTYQNVKPVQCLYFDGMSAALMRDGPLDSQMVFLCGNTTCSLGNDEPWRALMDEYARATALCHWVQQNGLGGLGWGVEGFVRMNAGFEMIWCNFTSPSLQLVSHVNVSAPLLPDRFRQDQSMSEMASGEEPLDGLILPDMLAMRASPSTSTATSTTSDIPTGKPDMPPPPNWRGAGLEPFLRSQSFEWYRSATWHTGSSGSSMGRPESRVKLNTCGFLSYYDPFLQEFSAAFARGERLRLNLTAEGNWRGPGKRGNHSVALKELSTRRRPHNLSRMTNVEAGVMRDAVLHTVHALNQSGSLCTGIDWAQKAVDVTSRFSRPLSQTLHLVSNPPRDTTNITLVQDYVASLRAKYHAMLVPYLTYPLTAAALPAIHARCVTSQTITLHRLRDTLVPNERSLLATFETVLSAICNTTVSLALDVEQAWQMYYQPNVSTPIPDPVLAALATHHSTSLSLLRAWLGWFPDDMQCDRVCDVDEFCFIPIWPLLFLEPRGGGGGGPGRGPPGGGPPGHHPPPGKGRRRGPGGGGPPRGNPWGDLDAEMWNPRCTKVQD
jgi:hypothetical protein